MDNFYIDLSSSSVQFKDNTPSWFRVLIQPTIKLKGRWEVALTEVALPHIKNITGQNHITTITEDVKKSYSVSEGYYGNVAQLMDALRTLRIPGVSIRHNKQTEKIYMSVTNGTQVSLDYSLATILGFTPHKKYTSVTIGDDTVDVFRHKRPLLFQTSLIPPQPFREQRRQLLRAIYQQGYIEFSPKYIPVIDSDLEVVTFQLTSATNQELEFNSGSVDFVLHFRKCSRA